MLYQNLDYVPSFVPVYTFVLKTDFDVPVDVTASTWKFEAFDCTGRSLYVNTTPTSATGNVVVFTIPVPGTPIFIEGNYSYRVSGTQTLTGVSSVWIKGFITVEPSQTLP